MGLMDTVLGVLLIGAYANCSLYALELVCLYFYFSRYNSKDHIVIRSLIAVMLLCDTANTVLQCVTVYLMAVTNYGDPSYLSKGTIFFALQALFPCTTALICQSFLIWRFFRISKHYIVSAALCIPSLAAWIAAIYACVALIKYTALEDRVKVTNIVTALLCLEAATDISIALALICLLGRYSRKTTYTETKSLLKRLMYNAAQTGAAPASVAVAMLVTFLLSRTTNINTGISYVLGRSYSLTLLFNLLNRPASDARVYGGSGVMSTGSAVTGKAGLGTFRVGGRPTTGTNEASTPVTKISPFEGQIDVSQQVTVHIDHELADEKGDFGHVRRDSSSGEVYELSKLSSPRDRYAMP